MVEVSYFFLPSEQNHGEKKPVIFLPALFQKRCNISGRFVSYSWRCRSLFSGCARGLWRRNPHMPEKSYMDYMVMPRVPKLNRRHLHIQQSGKNWSCSLISPSLPSTLTPTINNTNNDGLVWNFNTDFKSLRILLLL